MCGMGKVGTAKFSASLPPPSSPFKLDRVQMRTEFPWKIFSLCADQYFSSASKSSALLLLPFRNVLSVDEKKIAAKAEKKRYNKAEQGALCVWVFYTVGNLWFIFHAFLCIKPRSTGTHISTALEVAV